ANPLTLRPPPDWSICSRRRSRVIRLVFIVGRRLAAATLRRHAHRWGLSRRRQRLAWSGVVGSNRRSIRSRPCTFSSLVHAARFPAAARALVNRSAAQHSRTGVTIVQVQAGVALASLTQGVEVGLSGPFAFGQVYAVVFQ